MLLGSAGADAVAALTRESIGRACPRSQSEESKCLLCTNYQLALQSLAARVMHTSCLWSSPRLALTSRACWLHQRQWVTASGGGEDDKGGCCCGCLGDLWRVKGPVMTLCKIYKSNTCNYLRGWTEFTSQTLQQRRQRGARSKRNCYCSNFDRGSVVRFKASCLPLLADTGWRCSSWNDLLRSSPRRWCRVVPLSRVALISALRWGRLIPTALTLSPVLHRDTGGTPRRPPTAPPSPLFPALPDSDRQPTEGNSNRRHPQKLVARPPARRRSRRQ